MCPVRNVTHVSGRTYRTGHSKTCRFCARCSDERAQERALGSHDANFFRVHLDALGERAEIVAAVAAPVRMRLRAVLANVLRALFARVKAAHPDLEFVIDVNISPYLRDRLVARHLDLAFLFGPIDNRNVHNCPLCKFPVAFVASDRICDEIRSPHEQIALERIAKYDLVTFSRDTQPYMDLRELLHREGLHPKIHASASLEIVVRMALEGLAIAVIPPAILEDRVEAREKLRPLNNAIKLPDLNFVAG